MFGQQSAYDLIKYEAMPDITDKDKIFHDNQKIKARSWLFFFILFALIFGFVVYYFSEIKKEFKLLEKVNVYWLITAIFAQFLTYFFTAIIYRLLLRAQKLTQLPRLWNLLRASIISLFFNQTMPSAGISGNTFIFNFLAKFNLRVAQIVSLILVELLIFYAAMEIVILFLLITCLFFYKLPHVFTVTLAVGFIVYLIFGTLVAFAGKKKFLERFFKKAQKIKLFKKLFERVNKQIQRQGISKNDLQLLTFLKNNKGTVLKTFLIQLMVAAADGFTLYSLFYGLGIPVSAYVVLLSLISTKIISLLPFLPGSLLLYESSMSFFFVNLGVPLVTAIIVTLVYRLLSFWFPIPIGLFFYRRWLKKSSDLNDSPNAAVKETK